jgi:hypothetical protein
MIKFNKKSALNNVIKKKNPIKKSHGIVTKQPRHMTRI